MLYQRCRPCLARLWPLQAPQAAQAEILASVAASLGARVLLLNRRSERADAAFGDLHTPFGSNLVGRTTTAPLFQSRAIVIA